MIYWVRLMLKIFDRYILKEVFPPFLIGLLVTAFVLLMNQVLVLAELFIDRGVPAGVAARLFVFLVPSLLAFALPMAVLAGILGGLARLSADSEIIAFRTLGIGSRGLVRPLLIFGLGGWLVTSALTLVLAPRANFRWVQDMTSSVLARATLRVNPLEFSESVPNTVLFVEGIGPDQQWENVFAYLNKDPRAPRVIMARRGRINFFPGKKRATLELTDGVLHSGPLSEPETYSVTSFDRFEEEIDVESLFPTVTSEKRVREKDIFELLRDAEAISGELASPEKGGREGPASGTVPPWAAQKQREFRAHWVEIHKKFSLPFACFVFVLLGLPLGLMTGRGGRTGGLSLSMGIIILYYALITTGEKLAIDGKITPFLGMWGPDILLAAAGLLLFFRSGEDTDALARLAGAFRKKLAPLVPRLRPGPRARRVPRLPLRFPNLLDRYVARKYLAILGLVLTGLLGASVIVAFFERLDAVHRHGKPIGLLVEHIWFRIPEFLSAALPVAALTTTLLALGLLAKTNEVTAMKALGISLYRAIVPVLVLAAAVSGVAYLVQERVAPAAGIRAEEIWNRINDAPARRYSSLGRHWILGRGKDRIYHYEYYEPASSGFSRLSVFDIDPGRWTLTRRAYAEKASLGPAGFELRKGWLRDFAGGAAVPFAVREVWGLTAPEGRAAFTREWKEPQQMTYGELREYASEVRATGFEATRLMVDLRGKVAFPLASLVMTVLAIPFAFSMGKKGALAGIGLSIVFAAGYWGAFAVLRSLGYAGVLTPFLAAWGANLIFGLAGLFLLFRLRT
jgi:LPS export ABC transporter permease LptF/LPS export ABC transporter permease LptG